MTDSQTPHAPLLPCPFCGGAGHSEFRESFQCWQAYCSECHAGTSPSFAAEGLARVAWNNRYHAAMVNSDLLAALVALRNAVKDSGKMNGREYDALGIQVNNALAMVLP